MPNRAILGTLLLAAVVHSSATAQPVLVVHADADVTEVTKAELSKIFLKRLRTWKGGLEAQPVDQLPESPVREQFSKLVHERSVVNIEVYWKRMIFSGRGVPPKELDDDEAVLDFVRSTPGAVGYVSEASNLEGVRRLVLEE